MKVKRSLIQQVRPGRYWIAATVSLSVLQAGLMVAQAFLISRVLSAAFLQKRPLNALQFDLWLLLALSISRLVFNTVGRAFAVRASTSVKSEVRAQLIDHFHRIGPVGLSRERRGELVNLAQDGIESLDAYVSDYLPQIALAALIPITILAFILPLDLTSALVLLGTAPLIPLFMVLIGDSAEEISRRQWKTLGNMSARFTDVLQGLVTLKLFGRSRDQIKRLRELGEMHRRSTMAVLRVAFLSALVLELAATISTAIVAVQVGLRLLYGRIGFQQAFFVLILAPEFYLPLRTLGAKFHAGISGATALERMLEFAPVAKQQSSRRSEMEQFETLSPSVIQFDAVSVRFPGRSEAALEDVRLTFNAGCSYALIGPSGAGKTTIAQLLLRFIDPDQGQILIDGTPLESIDAQQWRRSVSWVPQNPYLFNGSVSMNIRLADESAPVERIEWAARQANAHDFISHLPGGYAAPVGENGLQLSAGQIQRIALARAFLKDAPLLILDEPTANLDRLSQDAVTESIGRLIPGRTALIIAHRLDTIENLDQIILMSAGSVLELGSHADLMRRSEVYASLQRLYRGEL